MYDNFILYLNLYDFLKMKMKGKWFFVVCFSCGFCLYVYVLYIVDFVRNLYYYICCGYYLCLN